jgi:pimeloyl-ACP methyl ester carboxylesterase
MVATKVHHQAAMTVEATHGTGSPPIWKESLWPVDWLALRMSPVYYGFGIPRGDGSPVVLVPGFMGVDAYLAELYMWLGRIGYRPYMSGIGFNVECPGRLTGKLARTIERAHRQTGKRARVVGHSLGGVLGRKACLQRPDSVRSYIPGQPGAGLHAHPVVVTAAAAMQAAREMVTGRQDDASRTTAAVVSRMTCYGLFRDTSATPPSTHGRTASSTGTTRRSETLA